MTKTVLLGDLVNRGDLKILDNLRKPLSSRERAERKGRYPYYGAAGQIDSVDDYKLEGPHLLVAEDGTVTGKNNLSPMLQLVDGKFWVSNHAHILQASTSEDMEFIKYALEAIDVNPYITGAVQPKLSQDNLRKLPIYYPDALERKAILKIIKPLDQKIELNRRMNETLEKIGQTLFKHYFVTNPDRKNWETVTLGRKIHPKRGKSLTSKQMINGEFPVVSGGLRPAGYHNRANTRGPVVTISASGANAGYVALWNTDVWSADSSFIDSTVTKDVHYYYIFLKANQKKIFDAQTGAAQPHIYPSHLELLEIPNAPDELMATFNERVSPLFSRIDSNLVEAETLTKLRDSLLPRLISGKYGND